MKALVAIALLFPVIAQAQMYQCTDASGNMSFQQSPCGQDESQADISAQVEEGHNFMDESDDQRAAKRYDREQEIARRLKAEMEAQALIDRLNQTRQQQPPLSVPQIPALPVPALPADNSAAIEAARQKVYDAEEDFDEAVMHGGDQAEALWDLEEAEDNLNRMIAE